MKLSGCEASDERASDIVESNAMNVAIIKPAQTIEEFWKNSNGNYVLDVANGGYPATFKYYAKKVK